jgi:SAM-dependent methyltransferase
MRAAANRASTGADGASVISCHGMGTSDKSAENVQLHAFTDLDRAASIKPYVAALEAFDALPQLQELKVLARERARIGDGTTVLDVGCGFGLESLRLAQLVEPGGTVTGIDKSADFIADAKSHAAEAKLAIDFQVGDAEALPFADASFDVARAERVLVYLPDPKRALTEMRRVTRPGGTVSAIEPDFGTNAINLDDRDLVRRILDHECDANIPHGWLVRDLSGMMQDIGLRGVTIDTRIVIFTPDLDGSLFHRDGQDGAERGRDRCGRVRALVGGDRGPETERAPLLQHRVLPVHRIDLSRPRPVPPKWGVRNFTVKQLVYSRETHFISGQCKECSYDQSNRLEPQRYLSPFGVEERPADRGGHHRDGRGGRKSIRADEAHA